MSRRRVLFVAVLAVAVVVLAVIAWGLSGSEFSVSVRDARTGEAIAGAEVSVADKTLDASLGDASARLPLGEHDVTITAPGYETTETIVAIGFFRPAELGLIELRDAALSVQAVENYPRNPPVLDATVTLSAPEMSQVATEGAAHFEGLPIGSADVTIEAEGYDTYATSIELQPGENSIVCTMTPELVVVVERSGEAHKTDNYSLIYELMHPDRQALWGSKTDYLDIIERDMDRDEMTGRRVESIEAHDYIPVEEHHDDATGKTYLDVFRVPRTYTVSSPMLLPLGMTQMTFTDSTYWLLVDGQWRTLDTGQRSELMP